VHQKERNPQQRCADVHHDPELPQRGSHSHLQEISGSRHRKEEHHQDDARDSRAAAVEQLAQDVSAQDHPHRKDQQRSCENVQVLQLGLPRMVHHRPLIGRGHQIAHPGVDYSGKPDRHVGNIQKHTLAAIQWPFPSVTIW
jgi:hypothetical protein